MKHLALVAILLVMVPAGEARAEKVDPLTTKGIGDFDLRLLPLQDRYDVERGLAHIVPGATLTAAGVRLWGGAASALVTTIDGFRLHGLNAPSALLGHVQLIPGGYGVANADAPEGMVDFRSHAPSGRLRVELDAATESGAGETSVEDWRQIVLVPRFSQDKDLQSVRSAVAAPLAGDHLSATAAIEYLRGAGRAMADARGERPDAPALATRRAKAAFSLMARLGRPEHEQRLQLLAIGNLMDARNETGLGFTPEAQSSRAGVGGLLGLRWHGRLARGVSVHAFASRQGLRDEDRSMLCLQQPEQCENIAPVLVEPVHVFADNRDRFEDWRERHDEAGFGLELATRILTTDHQLRLVGRIAADHHQRKVLHPGGSVTTLLNHVRSSETRYTVDDPRIGPATTGWLALESDARRELLALEDEVRLPMRLTITPGIGVVRTRLSRENGRPLLVGTSPVVHLAVRFDLDEEGRTSVSGTSGWRVDPTGGGIARLLPGEHFARRCLFNQITGDYDVQCEVSGGSSTQSVGLPCSPLGYDDQGTPCRGQQDLPRVSEQTLAVRHNIGARFTLGVEGFHRRSNGAIQASESNQIRNRYGVAIAYRNGHAEPITDISLNQDLYRRARGATFWLAGRVANLAALAAYSHVRCDVGGSTITAMGPFRYTRDDPDERRHALRALATYDLLGGLSFGAVYRYDSGLPYPATVPPAAISPAIPAQGPRGVVPGGDVNDPADERRLGRLQGSHRLDVQARLRGGHWFPLGLDLYFDILNALGARDELTGRADLPGGRWLRLGARMAY